MTDDGIIADDPYGRIRSNYNVAQVGDAYGEKGQAGRTASRKNQVDPSVDRTKPSTMDADWKTYGAQHLKPEEALGSSSQVADSVMQNAWRSIRFLEPAKKKAVADAAKPAVVPGQNQAALPK